MSVSENKNTCIIIAVYYYITVNSPFVRDWESPQSLCNLCLVVTSCLIIFVTPSPLLSSPSLTSSHGYFVYKRARFLVLCIEMTGCVYIILSQQKRYGCYDNAICSCMYSLLFVDFFVKLICSYIIHSFHTSFFFLCMMCMPHSSVMYIYIYIDVHPTHIPLTHGFQGNKHVVDVNDPCL